MSIFGDQSERLLRETWGSPTDLAEELYAMFQSNLPLNINGPVTITNPNPAVPALTVQQLGAFDPGNFPAGVPDAQPAILLLYPSIDPTPSAFAPDPAPPPPTTQNKITAPSGSIPGQVLSGGPGADYQVQIYPDGLGATPKTVAVTQLQIDAGETIQAGTWTLIALVGKEYVMQVPVWGAP